MAYAPEYVPKILIVDSQGQPVRWALMQRAARYYASGKVVTDLGDNLFGMAGGTQETTGLRSEFITSSIVMIRGKHRIPFGHAHVGLTKHRLFARDRNVCAYCGRCCHEEELTREHVIPFAQNGKDHWMNVVTACRQCNHRKSNRTPEQAHMPLLYAPYIPSLWEDFILRNRRILADQMEFLMAHLPKNSRLHA